MKPIISVERLGKRYTIRHEGQTPYKSLREELFKLPGKLLHKGRQQSKEEFWALRDVSFDVMPGERLGIIGRNGAGKSTLLKLLSRITEPTTGRITLRGRVASLLEVGTGFHPELTGRENIFLNGAILGMSRAEVRRKFDEIVDFAGVEKFLDTPVKRYSSGMYVRLAFAVAAHLEPEILIVDEVLAVGDAEFQKKCLGKMEDVGKEGRTVLFVSHNLNLISSLCSTACLFSEGHLLVNGPLQKAISSYWKEFHREDKKNIGFDEVGDAFVRLLDCEAVDESLHKIEHPRVSQKIGIRFTYEIINDGYKPDLSLHITNENEESIFLSVSNANEYKIGKYSWVIWIPENILNNRTYKYYLGIFTAMPHVQHILYSNSFSVEEDYSSITRKSNYMGPYLGVVRPVLEYRRIK